MGDLLSEIKKEHVRIGKKSKIEEIIEGMSDQDKKDLLSALDDVAIPASKISRVMARRGHKLSVQVIARYRRGELATKVTK